MMTVTFPSRPIRQPVAAALWSLLGLVALGAATPAQAAKPRFVAQADQVTDNSTALTWRRCAEGQMWNGVSCDGSPTLYTWAQALQAAQQAAKSSGLPWRLPNVKELSSLLDETRVLPAIDTQAFPGAPGDAFWSATPYAVLSPDAWSVNFALGGVSYQFRDGAQAIRLVRGGQ